MFYIVITTIFNMVVTPVTLPKAYNTLQECNRAIIAETVRNFRQPRQDEQIIFACVRMEGA
jgi:hypothetical protein